MQPPRQEYQQTSVFPGRIEQQYAPTGYRAAGGVQPGMSGAGRGLIGGMDSIGQRNDSGAVLRNGSIYGSQPKDTDRKSAYRCASSLPLRGSVSMWFFKSSNLRV